MINEDIVDAEIMWVLDIVMSNYSLNPSCQKNELFKTMFKDSMKLFVWMTKTS